MNERTRTKAHLLGSMVAALALAAAGPTAADEGLGPVLVLAAEDTAEHQETLRAAMAAHLSGYEVEVRLAIGDPLPESFPAQADAARRAVDEQGALAAIWVDDRHGMVFVLVAAPDADQILQRPLPAADEPWRARCDAVASMVHSALAPWFGRDEREEPATAPEPSEPPPPEPTQAEDPELPFEDRPEEEQPKPTGWLTLQVRAGYGPVVVNNTGSVQHGGRLGLGLIFGDHIEAEVALDLLVPLRAENIDEQGKDIALVRWPLRVAAAGFITALALDIGLKAGLTIDFTHISGVDTDLDTERVNPGFAAALYLRYRILGWLAVWVEGGLDIYASAYDYTSQRSTVIRYGAIQGRVSGGLAVLFGLI